MNQQPQIDLTPANEFEQRLLEAFGQDGALGGTTEHFSERRSQKEMALSVARVIQDASTLVAEAGTGTGKTFAYLAPVILSGRKAVISTAGKPLQDQLFEKDLPALEQAFGMNISAAILKGRANYVCLHRLKACRKDAMLPSRQAYEDLGRIEQFAGIDPIGDRSRCRGVSEDAIIWGYVTSTSQNCLGHKCKHVGDCFVNKARAAAKAAEVVVVNHHLYLSALSIKDSVDADMLPAHDVTIFDEAHKLPEIAVNFFGAELATYQIKSIAQEILRYVSSRHKLKAPKGGSWDEVVSPVVHNTMDLVLFLDEHGVLEKDAKHISEIGAIDEFLELMRTLSGSIDRMLLAVGGIAEDDDDLVKACQAMTEIADSVRLWVELLASPEDQGRDASGKRCVRWISRTAKEAVLHETPISFSENFRAMRASENESAWVFTSATLATQGCDFSHFLHEMGLDDVTAHAWASPFDFFNQAMLYVPERMPNPQGVDRRAYIEALVRESWPVIDLIGGRTFILCTSYQAMNHAADLLREYVLRNGRDYDVLVQGEDSRTELIARFRRNPRAILIGTMSFWEGIDIKGDALSFVVIDKLPFAPVGDPVTQAHCDWIEENGGNAFRDYSVPLATISLRQGAGRLIRSERDRGILMIGDTRIIASGYGKRFLESLPGYCRTRRLERVMDFWNNPEGWR